MINLVNIPSGIEKLRQVTLQDWLIYTLLVVVAVFTIAQSALYGYYYSPESPLRLLHFVVVLPAYALGVRYLLTVPYRTLAHSLGVLLFWLMAGVNVIPSGEGLQTNEIINFYLQTAAIPISILITDQHKERFFLQVVIAAAVFLVASNWYYAIVNNVIVAGPFRLGGGTAPQDLTNPNEVGYTIIVGCLAAFQLLLTPPEHRSRSAATRYRWLLWGIVFILVVSLLATASRGAMLAFGVTLAAIFFVEYRKVFWLLAFAGSYLAVIMLAITFLLPGSAFLNLLPVNPIQTFLNTLNPETREGQSLQVRAAILGHSYDIFIQNPNVMLMGEGIYDSERHLFRYMSTTPQGQAYLNRYPNLSSQGAVHTHNGFIAFLLAYGVLGGLVLLLIGNAILYRRRFQAAIYQQHRQHLVYAFVVFMLTASLATVPYVSFYGIVVNALLLYWFSEQREPGDAPA